MEHYTSSAAAVPGAVERQLAAAIPRKLIRDDIVEKVAGIASRGQLRNRSTAHCSTMFQEKLLYITVPLPGSELFSNVYCCGPSSAAAEKGHAPIERIIVDSLSTSRSQRVRALKPVVIYGALIAPIEPKPQIVTSHGAADARSRKCVAVAKYVVVYLAVSDGAAGNSPK